MENERWAHRRHTDNKSIPMPKCHTTTTDPYSVVMRIDGTGTDGRRTTKRCATQLLVWRGGDVVHLRLGGVGTSFTYGWAGGDGRPTFLRKQLFATARTVQTEQHHRQTLAANNGSAPGWAVPRRVYVSCSIVCPHAHVRFGRPHNIMPAEVRASALCLCRIESDIGARAAIDRAYAAAYVGTPNPAHDVCTW